MEPLWMTIQKVGKLLEQELEEKLEKTRTYVQRDLEDQIREEKEAIINNSNSMSTETQTQVVVQVVIQDVLRLLKEGYTRLTKDDMGYGSIQTHYNLDTDQVKELFRNPKLKMKKTLPPKATLVIIDNEVDNSAVISTVTVPLGDLTFRMEAEVAPSQDVVADTTEQGDRSQLFS